LAYSAELVPEGEAMASFDVFGPFDIPVVISGKARLITGAGNFWQSAKGLQNEVGCYVYAIRAGKGYTPCYVGKTKLTFGKECFAPDKLMKYTVALAPYQKGRPVLFLVAHGKQKGPINHKEIKEIEAFLTQIAWSKNPNLLNVKNVKQKTWSIQGIANGTQGKVNKATIEMRRALGLSKKE
jgi:hypothetical protein